MGLYLRTRPGHFSNRFSIFPKFVSLRHFFRELGVSVWIRTHCLIFINVDFLWLFLQWVSNIPMIKKTKTKTINMKSKPSQVNSCKRLIETRIETPQTNNTTEEYLIQKSKHKSLPHRSYISFCRIFLPAGSAVRCRNLFFTTKDGKIFPTFLNY